MIYRKIIIILIFIISYNINSQYINNDNFRLNNKLNAKLYSKNSFTKSQKSSFLAGTLSFIVPGAALGQFYNEEYINGAVRLGISAFCVAWFLASPSFDSGGNGNSDQKLMAGLLFTVNWIASIVDASVSASQTNRKIDNRKLHFNLDNNGLNFSVIF